jgi:hypothetical protein
MNLINIQLALLKQTLNIFYIMVGNKKLTYSEFVAKHNSKFSKEKLSKTEKARRYDDYLRQMPNESVGRNPTTRKSSNRSLSKRKTSSRAPSNSAITQHKAQCIQNYLKSLLDPFDRNSAVRLPAVVDGLIPSVVVHHHEHERLPNVANKLSIMMRPDLSRYVTYNQFLVDDVILRTSVWVPCKGEVDLATKYSGFKVVSQGIRVRYTGPPLTCTGILGATVLPPGNDLNNKSFQDLSTLPYTKIGPAIDGIEVVSLPFSMDQGFRRTNMTPNLIGGQVAPGQTWAGGNTSNPSTAPSENLYDALALFPPTGLNAGTQQQVFDTAQNDCMPWLLIFGFDLAADATFEVDLVTNYEFQLRTDANVPGAGGLFGVPSAAPLNASEASQATSLAQQVISEVGPVSTKAEPGASSVKTSRSTSSKVFNTLSDIASVGSTVYNMIDTAAIAATAVEWASPVLEALPAIAMLAL